LPAVLKGGAENDGWEECIPPFRTDGTSGCLVLACPRTAALSRASGAEEQTAASIKPRIEALKPGEILTYAISGSKIVTAGTAIMEIKEGTLSDGKRVLKFITTTHSAGLVDAFYRVNDRLESVFDPGTMQSLTFSLNESHGKKERRRELVFDHAAKTVISMLNNDPPEVLAIPDQIQRGHPVS
jgi:Protein of unknown function (DUF3108)